MIRIAAVRGIGSLPFTVRVLGGRHTWVSFTRDKEICATAGSGFLLVEGGIGSAPQQKVSDVRGADHVSDPPPPLLSLQGRNMLIYIIVKFEEKIDTSCLFIIKL